MPLPVLTFNTYLQNMIATLVNNTPAVTNLRPGSVAFALLQAVSGSATTLQQLITHVYNICRLATSTGADVDSFVGDFGLVRDPATFATVHVQISRIVTGQAVFIPVGAIVQTLAGVQFALIADPTNANYIPAQNAYFCDTLASSVDCTAQALVAGSSGNVLANTIVQIVSGVFGFNSVTNASAATGGAAQESDAALKARFATYIQSLGKATINAINAAIEAVQAGLTFTNNDQLHLDGSGYPGGFTIVVDDGSGAIPSGTLSAITTAVAAVKAEGIGFSVHAPTNVTINVSVSIHVHTGASPPVVNAAVQAAVVAYVNGLGVGHNVSYAGVGTVIAAVPNVDAMTSLLVNGGSSDIVIAFNQLARTATGNVTVTDF